MKIYAAWGVFWVLLGCGAEVATTAPDEGSREGAASVTQAYVDPTNDDVKNYPPWVRPYILPSAILSRYVQGNLDVKVAQQAMRSAMQGCACALGATAHSNEAVLGGVDTIFQMQYVVAAQAKRTFGGANSRSNGAAYDDDVPCGTVPLGPWPPPSPKPLLEGEREALLKAIAGNVKFEGLDLAQLDARIEQHLKGIDALLQ